MTRLDRVLAAVSGLQGAVSGMCRQRFLEVVVLDLVSKPCLPKHSSLFVSQRGTKPEKPVSPLCPKPSPSLQALVLLPQATPLRLKEPSHPKKGSKVLYASTPQRAFAPQKKGSKTGC